MRTFRTLVSALSIFLGALAIALWALGWAALYAVEDGAVFKGVAERSYDNPAFKAAITDEAQSGVRNYFERQGVNVEALRLGGALDALVVVAVESDAFPRLVETQVDSAREQFVAQLKEPDRPPGPLVIMVDISDVINEQFDNAPLIGAALPTVVLPPVAVEAVSEETFEDARTSYQVAQFARTWLLWVGLALLAIGLAVSPRRRWFVAKFLLAVGAIALGAWALMTFAEPATVAAWTPGGEGGTAGAVIAEVMTTETFRSVANTVLWIAVGLLAAAAIAAALAFQATQRGSQRMLIARTVANEDPPVAVIEPPAGYEPDGDWQPTGQDRSGW
ncbi:MAG: hypothetical protein CVT64_05485 [Actinobacteria bacterium HGW-Actinobacteria-4]|nr:MAG: hypothetical protein CVT64_05485 [Actinobacteria bacterium HGW-Actinobacteria-4]